MTGLGRVTAGLNHTKAGGMVASVQLDDAVVGVDRRRLVDLANQQTTRLERRTRCAIPIRAGRYRGNFYVPALEFKLYEGPIESWAILNRQGRTGCGVIARRGHPWSGPRRPLSGSNFRYAEETSPQAV